jgi:hypothetical protein
MDECIGNSKVCRLMVTAIGTAQSDSPHNFLDSQCVLLDGDNGGPGIRVRWVKLCRPHQLPRSL